MELESVILDLLKSHKFTILRKLGEGHFRSAYEVKYDSFPLDSFVAKVYKTVERGSVQHRVNKSKALEEQELRVLQGIFHPNVVDVYSYFQENGVLITLEEHFDAFSLEEKVRIQGPIKNRDFLRHIFIQAISALRYLHIEKRILHRDIKPSNILISRQSDVVKLVDFQTAKLIDEIEEKFLPTRGATSYTHPELINALLQGRKAKASIATEMYALGAVIYYVTTGQNLFQYSLEESEEGMPLQGGEEDVKIVLKNKRKKFSFISVKKHESDLKRRIVSFSSPFQELLCNLLSLERKAYVGLTATESYQKLQGELNYALSEPILPFPQLKLHKTNEEIQQELSLTLPGKDFLNVVLPWCHPQTLGLIIKRAIDVVRGYGERRNISLSDLYREHYWLHLNHLVFTITDAYSYRALDKHYPDEERYDRVLKVYNSKNSAEVVLRADLFLCGSRKFERVPTPPSDTVVEINFSYLDRILSVLELK